MAPFGKLLKESVPFAQKLARLQVAPLLALLFVDLALNLSIHSLMTGPPRPDNPLALQVAQALWELVQNILLFLVLCWGIPSARGARPSGIESEPFKSPYLGSFFAEYFRALAQELLYTLLLILPGIIRHIRLIYVPYIAIFSKDYRADKIDALQYSIALTKGRGWRIFGAIAFFGLAGGLTVLIPLIDKESFLLQSLSIVLGFFVGIWTNAFLYLMFEDAVSKGLPQGWPQEKE